MLMIIFWKFHRKKVLTLGKVLPQATGPTTGLENIVLLYSSHISGKLAFAASKEEAILQRLVRSVGRALHRYRRGYGFKSRTYLKFFQALSLVLVQ